MNSLARLGARPRAGSGGTDTRETRHYPSTLHARVAARGIQVDRELGDVAPLERADLADALLPDLVDADDRVQRQVAALDPGKLGLDALLGRVENYAAALPEHQFLDLDEAEEVAMADLAGVDLVDLALVDEHDPEYVTGGHSRGGGRPGVGALLYVRWRSG